MGYWVGDGCFELITLVVMVLKAIFVLCSTLFLCSIGLELPIGGGMVGCLVVVKICL